jgi:hypothetical protein
MVIYGTTEAISTPPVLFFEGQLCNPMASIAKPLAPMGTPCFLGQKLRGRGCHPGKFRKVGKWARGVRRGFSCGLPCACGWVAGLFRPLGAKKAVVIDWPGTAGMEGLQARTWCCSVRYGCPTGSKSPLSMLHSCASCCLVSPHFRLKQLNDP